VGAFRRFCYLTKSTLKHLAPCLGPREMLFKVLARLGFPPKIIDLVRVFHENVTLEVDLDDDGNTIIIKYNIGGKQLAR
jgi:hypothetical protein